MSQAPGFADCNVVFVFFNRPKVVGTGVQLSWLGVCLGSKGRTAYLYSYMKTINITLLETNIAPENGGFQ